MGITIDGEIKQLKRHIDKLISDSSYYEYHGDYNKSNVCEEQINEYESLLFWLEHYKEIRHIVALWNSDYRSRLTQQEYFDMILKTYQNENRTIPKTDDDEFQDFKFKNKDIITIFEEF